MVMTLLSEQLLYALARWKVVDFVSIFYIPSLKNGVSTGSSAAVSTPATTRERLPMAPQNSLSSVALLVWCR